MDISIIISGNLTGFSRFYASANANDIYNEAKFDFDYRNFLTFINAGEKAYAISFSPKVIAVSLITRILDSFRRPGILVVTALVPRYQLVSGTLNAQDKSAIYRLLNEINDKFYEKNFLNGMVNQNPAVLMQDYYSDILRNYALVSDRMQKAINTTIEVSSPNKRIGYVSSEEKDMPKYLSSLMRKSYSGYHHVFFADKAPANIDEPADEIVTYKVRVANDNRPIPGEVRLDDRIPTVSPQQGEKPISNQNYTYRQVLNGDAGNEIMATLENDTIVLTYRFQQEEKTIIFKFYDGANEVPLHVIRPIIVEANGASYPISTESWPFRGKEIYGLKTIKSGNSEYTIEPNSSRLDLQRLREGATHHVYVSKGWIWNFNPIDTRTRRPVTIYPVDIVLENRITGEYRNFPRVTGAVSERMPGNESDWIMKITSDYYEPITSIPNGGGYTFKRKQQPQPPYGGNTLHKDDHRGRTQTKTHGNSSSNQGLKFTHGQSNEAKEASRLKEEKKKRYIQYGIYAIVAVICCIGGWWAYTKLKPIKVEDVTPDNPTIATVISTTKNVSFLFKDFDGDELSDATLQKLSVSFEPSDIKTKSEDGKSYVITYDSTANPSQEIKVNVSFHDINMLKKGFQNTWEIKSLGNILEIPLSVKSSDIKLYQDINDGIKSKEEYNSYKDKVGKVTDRNYDYFLVLKNILESKKPIDDSQPAEVKPVTPVAKPAVASNSYETIRPGFNSLSLTLGKDKNSLLSGDKELKPSNPAEEKRFAALISILGQLNSGNIPSNAAGLSSDQMKIVNDLIRIARYYQDDKSKYSKLKSDLKGKNCKSLSQIKANIIKNENYKIE